MCVLVKGWLIYKKRAELARLVGKRQLDSPAYLTGTEASGTNVDPLDSSLFVNFYGLNVSTPGPTSVAIGMAYIVTSNLTLAAYFALSRHPLTPPFPHMVDFRPYRPCPHNRTLVLYHIVWLL